MKRISPFWIVLILVPIFTGRTRAWAEEAEIPAGIQYLESALESVKQAQELYNRELYEIRSKSSKWLNRDEVPAELDKANERLSQLKADRNAAAPASRKQFDGLIADATERLQYIKRMQQVYNRIDQTAKAILNETSALAGQYSAEAGERKRRGFAMAPTDLRRPTLFDSADKMYQRATDLYKQALDMHVREMESRETFEAELAVEGAMSPDAFLVMAQGRMSAASMRKAAAGLLNSIAACQRGRIEILKAQGAAEQMISPLEKDVVTGQAEIDAHKRQVRENYRLAEKLFYSAGKAFEAEARSDTDNMNAAALRLRARDAYRNAFSAHEQFLK